MALKRKNKCIDCKKEIFGKLRCAICNINRVNSTGLSKRSQYKNGHRGLIGNKNPSWKGGRRKASNGYIYIKNKVGRGMYKREHHLVMEKLIGRELKMGEVVHHIDRNKNNNHPKNLMYFKNNYAHLRIHQFAKKYGINLDLLNFKQSWLYE